jgi:ABC-type branched-subunit amino acid transport system ATPase component/MFS family permease
MSASGGLDEVRAGEAAIATLERDARELRDLSMAALGFASDARVPRMRDAIRSSGAGWSNLLAVSVVSLPIVYLTLVFLMFDNAIASTLGTDLLGYQYPGLFSSVEAPLVGVGAGLAAFFTAWLTLRKRCRTGAIVFAAFAFAAGMWLAAFSTEEVGLIISVVVAGLALGAHYASVPSLLIDAYPPGVRVRVISTYVLFVGIGTFLGALLIAVGTDSWSLTWRGILMILAGVATVVAFASLVVRDPGVGRYDLDRIDELVRERVGARGAFAGELSEEDVAVGFGEQMRQLFATRSALVIVIAFTLYGAMIVSLPAFLGQFVVARYGWGLSDRAWLLVLYLAVGLVPLAGLFLRGDHWFSTSPPRLLRYVTRLSLVSAVSLIVTAYVANRTVTVVGVALVSVSLYALLVVGYVVLLSIVHPRLRPHAASFAGITIVTAVLAGGALPGQLSSRYGVTAALTFFALNFLGLGGAARIVGESMPRDLGNLIEGETEREELRVRVSSGQHFPLLGCRHIDFCYGQIQVLFGVDFTVDDGEMVALLGTNGAGKSTLLKVISGIGKPTRGSVHYRGADITYIDPQRRVRYGITQMPGGRSVFGTMSVAENLRMYGFSVRKTRRVVDDGIEATFEAFPALAQRRNQAAATLSGGEQQMLSLGKAFILRPRLLLIDELSLGLAPLVVGRLIDMVRRINESGTAVVLVEQSVNIALAMVDHAYFMERGEVRFDGDAHALIERPDLLRSVFLEGASRGMRAMAAADAKGGDSASAPKGGQGTPAANGPVGGEVS